MCILSPRPLQMMNALGRPAIIVNLDPGNENIPYKAAVDIRELVAVPVVMEEMGLGINGALVYAGMHDLRLKRLLASLCPVLRTHHNAPLLFHSKTQFSTSHHLQIQHGVHRCKFRLARREAEAAA